MSSRTTTRSRMPLGQRAINVNNNNQSNAKQSSSSSILPSKKSSSSGLLNNNANELQRSASTASTTTVSSTGGVSVGNNKQISSMSSDTLRRAINNSAAGGASNNNDSTTAETGGGFAATKKTQPLGSSKHANNNGNNIRPTPSSTKITKQPSNNSSSSSEPITIVEHRKRPCGDGYTVHKYLKGKLLGKGGFAKVYKVTSLDTNKEYAVKIVPKANLVKSRARQKLQTEIKIHRSMKHSQICEYKHFFEDKTNCYILLELCHNHSMNEMIKRRKYLTEEETRLLMLQIVDSVSFMHNCNVIHRDLKLGNLFLSKSMNIKVGDFGLACRVDSTDEKRKTICGTPNYIAPEVIEGCKEKRGHSFEVDIWSMGVICFTMMVGKPPYESKDVKSTYRRILANEYSFPNGKVSESGRSLIGSMLQTNPKMRPSLEEIRQHPFFTMHQIPSSLPATCTTSAPIWATDEFGELNAIKPKSALDIPSATSSSKPTLVDRAASTIAAAASKKLDAKTTTTKKPQTGTFNIYDDVNNDQIERKHVPRQAQQPASVPAVATTSSTPVNKLTNQLASCALGSGDDAERDMPPPSSSLNPLSPQDAAAGGGSSTPAPPQQSSPSAHSDDQQELIMMHTRLEECLVNYDRIQNGGPKVECPLKGGEVWGANKWVTRYVDYTSKYGLGFLINDGSSGVYFNDSTKAVHAADSDDFVYVERRKTCSSTGSVNEPVSNYTMSDYPEDALKKKVTLLQHFRSYLLEQQKRAEDAGEVGPLSSMEERRQDVEDDGNEQQPMVYMKKWIKTKHAMLFRLSNGTVQVLFHDMTEVLISSEGNLITYVDKEKNRFVHSIAEIANKQCADISRRLKYAKEILSQLISASKR